MLTAARTTIPRPWWWDGAVAAFYGVIAVLSIVVWPTALIAGLGGPVAWRLAVALVLAALVVLRTRRPVGALSAAVPLVALDVALGSSITAALVLADLLFCSALYGSPTAGQGVRRAAFAVWAGLVVVVLLVSGDAATTVGAALSGSAVLVLPVLWARDVRRPTEEAAAVRREAAQAARIAELDRRAAVTAERARVARDLHDSVAGHLSAIALQSQAALGADAATAAGDALRTRVLGSVRENSVRALDEMRALIDVLRRDAGTDPAAPDGESRRSPARLAELPGLVETARVGGLSVATDLPALQEDHVPAPVGLTAYRIAQEALTNVTRHAPGAEVTLHLVRDASDLVLEVTNTVPAGPPTPPGTGSGVEGMRVRAEAVGGSAVAGPDGDRWRVHARLPLGTPS